MNKTKDLPWDQLVKEGKAKPKTKRLWSDDEALLLIKYWKTEEPLYNTKSEKYHIKDEKAKSIKKIALKLHDHGISGVNEEMINEKTGFLKSYYRAGKKKEKASRRSGAGTSEVYISTWKFITELNFLNEIWFHEKAFRTSMLTVIPHHLTISYKPVNQGTFSTLALRKKQEG